MNTDRFRFRAWDIAGKRYIPNWMGTFTDLPLTIEGIVLEQCTGLTDKNGRLIYEGDIVKFDKINKGVITWSKYAPAFICERDGWNVANVCKKLEIIGNIHEDTKLLEDKEK